MSPIPIEVFYSYADTDGAWLDELEKHLSLLQREGFIKDWHKRHIIAGTDWKKTLNQQLDTASVVLLLISADFFASNYCYGVEMQRAMARHEAGEAHVIPILLRPTDWQSAPFAYLQPLPSNRVPVSLWKDRDEAFLDVVKGIKYVIEQIQKHSLKLDKPISQAPQFPNRRKRSDAFSTFPSVWNIPYRYPAFFTGRDQVVEKLFDHFVPQFLSGPIPAWALTGLGGLGKTQTAVAYAYRHRSKYQSVLWVNAETKSDLVTSFTNMAKLLALPGVNLQQSESVLDCIQKWFINATDWLLIVDNADDLEMTSRFLPKFASGHVLLTSRVAAIGQEAQSQKLLPLLPDDGALCILRRANKIPWTGQLRDASSPKIVEVAQELSQLMNGLPLALEQAGAYIETTGRGVGGYLELYKEYRPEIQKHYQGDIHLYRTPVATTWTIARNNVANKHPAALELLHLCAFLAPNAIPYALFPNDTDILGLILGPIAADPLRLDEEVMKPLLKHSLIQQQEDRGMGPPPIFIHRVLQEIIRDDMDLATQQLWAERAVRVVALALDKVEWLTMQTHAQHCLSFIEQWQMNFHQADIIINVLQQKLNR